MDCGQVKQKTLYPCNEEVEEVGLTIRNRPAAFESSRPISYGLWILLRVAELLAAASVIVSKMNSTEIIPFLENTSWAKTLLYYSNFRLLLKQ